MSAAASPISNAIQSMTGAGVASGDTELGSMTVELRSVNGRGLKLRTRLAPDCQGLEPAIEDWLRKRVVRGHIQLSMILSEPALGQEKVVDFARAEQALEQLTELVRRLGLREEIQLAQVLAFPGVLPESERPGAAAPRLSWQPPPGVKALLDEALEQLLRSRLDEGQATVAAMVEESEVIEAELEEVAQQAPAVVQQYREKLRQRVNEFLEGQARAMQDEDVIREVAVYADRVDVTEELQRLRMHLEKMRQILGAGGQVGRSLEFLVQEMLREANTLGSKTPDAEIAHKIVRIKSGIDRLKEQAANLE